jgi:2-dehydropantoate 2-reductase
LKILVIGAGAIGCFVGGRLATAGCEMTLVGRPALMEKIAEAGLILRHPGQPQKSVRPETTTLLAGLNQTYQFILITVKAPDTPQAIEQLLASGLSLADSYIVSLQNGVGNEERLADAFGPQKVIAGTITIPISVPEPGVIEVSKAKGGMGLAPLRPNQPVARLAEVLNQAGLATPIYKDYRAMKWSKLLLNIVNNASSAILNQPPRQIIARPDLFDLEIEALQEGVAVMKAQGIRAVKLPGYPVNWLAWLVAVNWLPLALKRAVLRPFMVSGRGAKMPSLQIDLEAGRPKSEIGVLNGAIVEAGKKVGVRTPVNQALTEILSNLVLGEVKWQDYKGRPEKLLEAVKTRRRDAIAPS